jgi:hypothetical protein
MIAPRTHDQHRQSEVRRPIIDQAGTLQDRCISFAHLVSLADT